MTTLDDKLKALEALANPPEDRAWNGPRNLPKPDARKKRRRTAREARRRNRA